MCRQPVQHLINRRLLIDILIVCVTSMLGTLLIHARIIGTTGLRKYWLTSVLPLFEICSVYMQTYCWGHCVS